MLGTPLGRAATVAVLWGDLPLLTRMEACCQLIIISAIALWKSFLCKGFPFPAVTLTSPGAGRGGRGQHRPAQGASLRLLGAGCAVLCAPSGSQASCDSLRGPRTRLRAPRGRPPLHSANTPETARRATRR